MQINETTYNAMPAHLRALFVKLPNPGKEEVLAGFPNSTSTGGLTPGIGARNGKYLPLLGFLIWDTLSTSRKFVTLWCCHV